MKKIILILSVSFLAACANKKAENKFPTELNGTWKPTKEVMGGMDMPDSMFVSHTLTISDTTYTMVAESVDKGVVRANGNKLDIYGKDGVNNGKHFTAIWKMENGKLVVCYNLAGDSYPTTFDTKGHEMFFMAEFSK